MPKPVGTFFLLHYDFLASKQLIRGSDHVDSLKKNCQAPLWKDHSLLIRFLILKEIKKSHRQQTASDLELSLLAISGLACLPPFPRTPISS